MKRYIKWISIAVGAIAIAACLRGFAFTSYLIPSGGMENALFCGDRILVNKWSYGFRVPLMQWGGYHRWNSHPVHKGDIVVFNNPADLLQPVIDRREVFISRCAGPPGDTLLVDTLFTLIPSGGNFAPDRKQLFTYPRSCEHQLDSLLSILSIAPAELMGQDSTHNLRSFSRYEFYLLDQAINGHNWIEPVNKAELANSRPLIIPGKGKAVRVYPWNRVLLRNTLVLHEGKQAEIVNDTLYVEGTPTLHCYFTKDYYWMVSDNSVNLSDSRLFGLVPHDHLIGKEMFVWLKGSNR